VFMVAVVSRPLHDTDEDAHGNGNEKWLLSVLSSHWSFQVTIGLLHVIYESVGKPGIDSLSRYESIWSDVQKVQNLTINNQSQYLFDSYSSSFSQSAFSMIFQITLSLIKIKYHPSKNSLHHYQWVTKFKLWLSIMVLGCAKLVLWVMKFPVPNPATSRH
jgi:hypothetical protein